MTIAYIAHPIAGDVPGNVAKIKAIISQIAREEENTVPIAPYLTTLEVLDDTNLIERMKGIEWNREILRRGVVDEVRLYGDRISDGMWREILSLQESVFSTRGLIIPMTDATQRAYDHYLDKKLGPDRHNRCELGPDSPF